MSNHVHEHDPQEEPGNENVFKLRIEAHDLAAWMAITNSFCENPPPHPREGVLVQWGEYIGMGTGNDLQNVFHSVVLKAGGNEVHTRHAADLRQKMLWINIVQEAIQDGEAVHPAPVDSFDLWRLRIRHPRIKSIHNYLEPFPGGITLWVDEKAGWTCRAVFDKGAFGFTFWLARNDGLRVRVQAHEWADALGTGESNPLVSEAMEAEINEVVLVLDPNHAHPGHINPPPGT